MKAATHAGDRLQEMMREGKAARKQTPRTAQSDYVPVDRDPVSILEGQHESRIEHLAPVRFGRMMESPFAFYRGSAALMAHDLARHPHSGQRVVACGDAHIANFGLFATPERNLTFELNDFDEVSIAPWEWDVKRLATSVLIAGVDAGLRRRDALDATRRAVGAYRKTLTALLEMSVLERFYHRGATTWLNRTLDKETYKLVQDTMRKARKRTSDQVLERIVTTTADGVPRIVDQPPIMMHVEDVTLDLARALMRDYLKTVRTDIRLLLMQFEPVDVVRRVVGIGSVGAHCSIILLIGPNGEPLFLQAKEAPPSVLETHGGEPCLLREYFKGRRDFEGFRVVTGQRILQTASDPFLGYFNHAGRDCYIRQFRDMKGSFDIQALSAKQFRIYVESCAALLARGHAQNRHAAFISGYMGASDVFDRAITRWAEAYAEQVDRDFAALHEAVASGRIAAVSGI